MALVRRPDRIATAVTLLALCALMTASCVSSPRANAHGPIPWFPPVDPPRLRHTPGVAFIDGLPAYQQTMEHTCGVAALMTLGAYYRVEGITLTPECELRIAREIGAREIKKSDDPAYRPGIKPDEMAAWLRARGFTVSVEYEDKEDASGLRRLQDNVTKGVPTIVEWSDLMGHWVIVVGYDTRNNDDPWDDVLILSDSYDRYDDYRDGYTFVNANKFYWLWYDIFCSDKLTWRTMITATPKGRAVKRP